MSRQYATPQRKIPERIKRRYFCKVLVGRDPIRFCDAGMARGALCCSKHWRRLSAETRDRIVELARVARGSDEHIQAALDALARLNAPPTPRTHLG